MVILDPKKATNDYMQVPKGIGLQWPWPWITGDVEIASMGLDEIKITVNEKNENNTKEFTLRNRNNKYPFVKLYYEVKDVPVRKLIVLRENKKYGFSREEGREVWDDLHNKGWR